EKEAAIKALAVPPLTEDDLQRGKAHKRCPAPLCDRHYPSTAILCGEHGCLLVPAKGLLLHSDEILLDGRFKVKKWIGRGSLHDVFVAEDQQNGQMCAVKILRFELGYDNKTVRRCVKELIQNMSLDHPYIAKTFGHGTKLDESGERPFSVCEYLTG